MFVLEKRLLSCKNVAFFSCFGGAMRLGDREPKGEKGVKTRIGWVRIDRTCIFSASASGTYTEVVQ